MEDSRILDLQQKREYLFYSPVHRQESWALRSALSSSLAEPSSIQGSSDRRLHNTFDSRFSHQAELCVLRFNSVLAVPGCPLTVPPD